MKYFSFSLAICVSSLFCWSSIGRADPDASVQTGLLRGLESIQKSLSTGNSFEYEALVKVTSTEEFLNLAPRLREFKFKTFKVHGEFSDSEGLIQRDRLDGKGNVSSSYSYYINSENVVVKSVDRGSSASIVPIKKFGFKSLPPNVDGPLLIFGFLQPEFDAMGVRAVTPDLMHSKEAWAGIMSALPSATIQNGEVSVTMNRKSDIVTVVFGHSPTGSDYWPTKLMVTTLKKAPIVEVTVKDFIADASQPGMPKTLQMKYYLLNRESDESILECTWEYEVTKATNKTSFDKDALTFDPSSVDKIFDTGAGVSIAVPR